MNEFHGGIRKAAILIASLDVQSAESLLGQMLPAQADAVRKAAAELGDLDIVEQNEVIDEFFRIGPLVPDKQASGIEPGGSPSDAARARSSGPRSHQDI